MNIPTGFRKWRFHWFECPTCEHRAYRTWAHVSAGREPTRIVWRFWCERCGAYATLGRPAMPTIAAGVILLLVGPVAFAVLYKALLAGLRFEWLVLVFACFWVAYPLIFVALTRLTYRYVAAP